MLQPGADLRRCHEGFDKRACARADSIGERLEITGKRLPLARLHLAGNACGDMRPNVAGQRMQVAGKRSCRDRQVAEISKKTHHVSADRLLARRYHPARQAAYHKIMGMFIARMHVPHGNPNVSVDSTRTRYA